MMIMMAHVRCDENGGADNKKKGKKEEKRKGKISQKKNLQAKTWIQSNFQFGLELASPKPNWN